MKSMLSKFWLGITLTIIIIFALVWTFQVLLLENFYVYERTKAIETEARSIASMIEKGAAEDAVQEEIYDFRSSFDFTVLFLNRKGEVLSRPQSPLWFLTSRNRRTMEFIRPYLKEEKPFTVTRGLHPSGERIRYIITGQPIRGMGQDYRYVVILSPLEPIEETTGILKKQLTFIGLISIMIGSILSFFLANMFSKPIKKINSASRMIAQGNYNIMVETKSEDEIGMLANTINDMAYQLKQIDRFKREFIANMSHELKTPISSIRAYGELLSDLENVSKSERDEYANIIVENSKKLNQMVEDILELSEMESGSYKLELSDFNLTALAKDVISGLNVHSRAKGIEIVLDEKGQQVPIWADRDKTRIVFSNLLSNAIRHSYQDSRIDIIISAGTADIHVEIIDYGQGIASEHLPYVWDRFYKVDKSRKNNKSGSGLGMAIVKNIFELHGFEYGIQSQLGEGTKVWFNIPMQ